MTAYLRARTLDEALEARAAHLDWTVMAGCTDLMVNANHKAAPVGILDVWRLPALCAISASADGVTIGAGASWLEIQRHPTIATTFAPLAAAAREIGALQIQARATLGGNVGTSSPVGDSLPVLLAFDTELELASVRGRRRVAYRDYCTGYRKTLLAPDELIVSAFLPTPSPTTRTTWKKVGTRRAQSISKVMGSAAIDLDSGAVRSARVALGAVADRPIRIAAVEAAVRGLTPKQAADAARTALQTAIKPIDDVRSTAAYRLDVAANLVARFFSDLVP